MLTSAITAGVNWCCNCGTRRVRESHRRECTNRHLQKLLMVNGEDLDQNSHGSLLSQNEIKETKQMKLHKKIADKSAFWFCKISTNAIIEIKPRISRFKKKQAWISNERRYWTYHKRLPLKNKQLENVGNNKIKCNQLDGIVLKKLPTDKPLWFGTRRKSNC